MLQNSYEVESLCQRDQEMLLTLRYSSNKRTQQIQLIETQIGYEAIQTELQWAPLNSAVG